MNTKILLPLLILSLFSKSQVNLSSSLSACYSLNSNVLDPINSLTGTLSMVTYTVDRNNVPGSAAYFNGTASCFVRLPNDPLIKPADAVSFSIWVKPNNNGGSHIIYTRNNLSFNFEAYQLCVFSGAPVFRLNKSSSLGNDIVLSTTTVTPGTWYHIVGTIDNSNLKLYINGVLEGTTSSSFPGFDYMVGREVFLGATNEFFTAPYDGSMDNLRFYNRTLNASEVTTLYLQDPACVALAPAPLASFTVSQNTICAGNSIQFTDLSTNTPTAWLWSVAGAPTQSSTVQNPIFNFPNSGNYTVSLSASNSSGTGSSTMAISVLPLPTISIAASNTSVCMNSSLTMTASGAVSYTWNTGQAGPLLTVYPSSQTTYTVKGASANGCEDMKTIVISVFPLPTVSIAASKTLVCINTVLSMTASGASTYSWSLGATGPTLAVYPNSQISYLVYGTSINGCIGQATFQVKTSDCVSISETNSDKAAFSVYPNPFQTGFFIETSAGSNKRYQIVDLLGNVVLVGQISDEGKTPVDMHSFSKGIYFLMLIESASTRTVKIIKD